MVSSLVRAAVVIGLCGGPLVAFAHSPLSNGMIHCERLLVVDSSVDGPLNMKAYLRLEEALRDTTHKPHLNPHLSEAARIELGLNDLTEGEQTQLRIQSRWEESESAEVEITTRSSRDASEKFVNLWMGSLNDLLLWTSEKGVRGLRIDSWRNLPDDGEVGFLLFTPKDSLAQRRFLTLKKISGDLGLVTVGFDIRCEDLGKLVSSSEKVWSVKTRQGDTLCRVPAFEFRIKMDDDRDVTQSF